MYDPWTGTKVGGKRCWWEGGAGQSGIKGEKWDNYNSIVNKIYF